MLTKIGEMTKERVNKGNKNQKDRLTMSDTEKDSEWGHYVRLVNQECLIKTL